MARHGPRSPNRWTAPACSPPPSQPLDHRIARAEDLPGHGSLLRRYPPGPAALTCVAPRNRNGARVPTRPALPVSRWGGLTPPAHRGEGHGHPTRPRTRSTRSPEVSQGVGAALTSGFDEVGHDVSLSVLASSGLVRICARGPVRVIPRRRSVPPLHRGESDIFVADGRAETHPETGRNHVPAGKGADASDSTRAAPMCDIKEFRHLSALSVLMVRSFPLAPCGRHICGMRTKLFLTRDRIRAEPRRKHGFPRVFS